MVLIDAAIVLYCGFMVLFIWRALLWWECCGRKIKNLNYVTIGLALITVILAYDSFYFIQVATSIQGKKSWDSMPCWLRPVVLMCPILCLVTLIASSIQIFQHVERIHEGASVKQHDRAVQILLLPVVYGVMAMSSLTRMYNYVGLESQPYAHDNQESLHRSLARSETCFWVGDLYESWALYQFSKMIMDVIDGKIRLLSESDVKEEVAAAHGLRYSYRAVDKLAWLGIWSFLVVCIAESGWSLWLLTFDTSMTAEGFDQSMSKFVVAGFLASGVAIYNVFVVEEEYGSKPSAHDPNDPDKLDSPLTSFHPRLKFFTVKILVTFAFVQRGIFKIWSWCGTIMPPNMKKWVDKAPFLGEVMNMPAAQFEMFYAALIITECFLVCIAHYWAWNSEEDWYEEASTKRDEEDGVSKAFAPSASLGNKSYGSQPAP